MADDPTKNALADALKWLAGTGVGAAAGVFLKGLLTGASGQESEVRKALQEETERLNKENERLRDRARYALEWQDLCNRARWEAEKLGYDPSKWPDDPKEDP